MSGNFWEGTVALGLGEAALEIVAPSATSARGEVHNTGGSRLRQRSRLCGVCKGGHVGCTCLQPALVACFAAQACASGLRHELLLRVQLAGQCRAGQRRDWSTKVQLRWSTKVLVQQCSSSSLRLVSFTSHPRHRYGELGNAELVNKGATVGSVFIEPMLFHSQIPATDTASWAMQSW